MYPLCLIHKEGNVNEVWERCCFSRKFGRIGRNSESMEVKGVSVEAFESR